MNHKFLIIPLMLFGFSLSSCAIPITQYLQISGEWEATDIYFEALDFSVDSLKIVVVENSELDYGYTYTTYQKGQKTLNLSVWENGTNVSYEEYSFSLDDISGNLDLFWYYGDYYYSFISTVEGSGKRKHFDASLYLFPSVGDDIRISTLDVTDVVLKKFPNNLYRFAPINVIKYNYLEKIIGFNNK